MRLRGKEGISSSQISDTKISSSLYVLVYLRLGNFIADRLQELDHLHDADVAIAVNVHSSEDLLQIKAGAAHKQVEVQGYDGCVIFSGHTVEKVTEDSALY